MQRFPVWSPSWLSHRLNLTSVIAGRRCINRVPLGASTRWKSTRKTKKSKKECHEEPHHQPLFRGSTFNTGDLVFSEPQFVNDDVAAPPLSAEQQALVDLILTGRNVFYTGAAGTGKSHVLRAAVERLRAIGHRVQVVAPTGKAALAVNGMTTWSYAGWTPLAHTRPLSLLRKWAFSKYTYERLTNTDVLVIDEISMVENHHLKRLDEIMKEARAHAAWAKLERGVNFVPIAEIWRYAQGIRQAAFGGCQIIATGDFFQLPPVLPFQHCIECGLPLLKVIELGRTVYSCPSGHGSWPESHKWAFQSEVWSHADFTHVELSQIHRQKGDPTFIDLLNRVRSGTHTYDDVMVLADPARETKDLTNAVRLFPTRFEVSRYNEHMLSTLKTPSHDFVTRDSFHWNEEAHPHLESQGDRGSDDTLKALREHRYEPFLRLKIGMPVILLTNLDISKGLVNGSQGIIVNFVPIDLISQPYLQRKLKSNSSEDDYVNNIIIDEIFEYCRRSTPPIEVLPQVKFDNEKTRIIYPDCADVRISNNIQPVNDVKPRQSNPTVLTRTQIPLAAGWAMSIHKAQGMSLDKVIVDLTRAFAEGQVYVALSRARRLDGLKVEGDPLGLFKRREGNRDVWQFYREKFNHKDV